MDVEFVLNYGASPLGRIDVTSLSPDPAMGGHVPIQVTEKAITGVGTMVKRLAHFGIHIIPKAAKTAIEETIEWKRRMTAMMTARSLEVVFADTLTHIDAP
jgi:hypothetical protein